MMTLEERNKAEADAIWKIIRVLIDMPNTDIAFSALLAVAKAIVLTEIEQGRGRDARWRSRADILAPRAYQLMKRILAGELRAN